MAVMCRGKKCQIQNDYNVWGSKMTDSARLDYVMVKKNQIQHGWNVTWSKTADLTRLECVLVKIIRFSIDGTRND